jgi:hypothetical protein
MNTSYDNIAAFRDTFHPLARVNRIVNVSSMGLCKPSINILPQDLCYPLVNIIV